MGGEWCGNGSFGGGEGESNVGLFQGAAVVGAVSAHGDSFFGVLVGHDDFCLVVGFGPRVDCSFCQQGLFQLGNLLDFAAEELVESVAGEAELTSVLSHPLEQLFYVGLFIV